METWCGNGWTGQPTVIERDGRTWVITGGYDHKIHFVDAATGERIIPDFVTNDLVKGSLSLDPDGYPLVYSGSRDGYYRIISYDGDKPKELWKLNANSVQPKYGDNDWDSAGLIIDDYLFQNGENGNFHIVKLNRGYDAGGKVTVRARTAAPHPQLGRGAPEGGHGLLGRELGRDLQERRLLRQLVGPRAGLGPERPQGRPDAHPGLPLLDR